MSVSSPLPPQIDPQLADAANTTISAVSDGIVEQNADALAEDGRSSSLSDIGNSKDPEVLAESSLSEQSDVNDTEAETERLDESPEKARKKQNVVLTSAAAFPTVPAGNSSVGFRSVNVKNKRESNNSATESARN